MYPTSDTSNLGVITSDYDETGNGLMDVRVEWSDDGSGVDPSTFSFGIMNTGTNEIR